MLISRLGFISYLMVINLGYLEFESDCLHTDLLLNW